MAAGAAETIAQGLYRARGLVLAVLAVAAIGAAIEIGLHQLPSPEVAIRVVVILAGIWILAIFHMRHAWLSGLAAAAPLPGLLVVFAVSGNFESLTAGYAFGLTVSLFATDEVAARIADATPAQTAAIGTLRDFGTVTASVVLIALILPLVLHWITGGFEVSWFAGAASAMSAILMVTLAAPFLKFGEVFVTGFNRVRETQERLAATLVSVAYIRWGASVAGVSVIVCALGYFGASTLAVAGALHHLWLFVFLIFSIASVVAFCLVRDWRRTCATVFSFAPALLLAL